MPSQLLAVEPSLQTKTIFEHLANSNLLRGASCRSRSGGPLLCREQWSANDVTVRGLYRNVIHGSVFDVACV